MGIFPSPSGGSVFQFFSFCEVETIETIRASIEIITDAIFIFDSVSISMRYVQEHFLPFSLKCFPMLGKRNFRFFFFICFWRELLIIDTMALASEIETEEAVSAILAIVAKEAVLTVVEILGKEASIAPMDIGDFVAVFGIISMIEIDAVLRSVALIPVEELLSADGRNY